MFVRNAFAILLLFTLAVTSQADDRYWTGSADNQFLNADNWDTGLPNSDEDVVIIDEGGQFCRSSYRQTLARSPSVGSNWEPLMSSLDT